MNSGKRQRLTCAFDRKHLPKDGDFRLNGTRNFWRLCATNVTLLNSGGYPPIQFETELIRLIHQVVVRPRLRDTTYSAIALVARSLVWDATGAAIALALICTAIRDAALGR